MTPPCLGSSLLALVPGASRDIIWPLPSKMLFARAPGVVFFFISSHKQSGNINTTCTQQQSKSWKTAGTSLLKTSTKWENKAHRQVHNTWIFYREIPLGSRPSPPAGTGCPKSPAPTSHPSQPCPQSFPMLRHGGSSLGPPSPTQKRQLHNPKQDLAHSRKWWD